MSNYDQRNQKVDKQINAEKISIGTKPIVCLQCHYENPPKAKFCSECGTSLMFKCPICQSETVLGSKFCSGCGKAISSIQKDIEIAQKAGGANKELSFSWHTRYDNHSEREVLAVDEYVLLKQENVFLYKDDIPDTIGELYLTNRRLIILGYEHSSRVFGRNYSYPLKDTTHAGIKKEKVLFSTNYYLQIIHEGRVRNFLMPETTAKTWATTILQYVQQNK